MSIESLLETDKLAPTVLAGVLCTAVIAAGTIETNNINASMVDGAVLLFVADDGSWQWHVQSGAPVGVGPYTITLHDTVRKTASGGAGNSVCVVEMNSAFFQPTTTFPTARAFCGIGASGTLEQLLKGPGGEFGIDASEGILLKSVYVRLPYQFTFAETSVPVSFAYRIYGTGGAGVPITQIGEGGLIHIPVENIEIPLNVYIPPKGISGQQWEIVAKLANSDASEPDNTRYNPGLEQIYTHVSTLDMNTTIAFEFLPITIGVRMLHASIPLIT